MTKMIEDVAFPLAQDLLCSLIISQGISQKFFPTISFPPNAICVLKIWILACWGFNKHQPSAPLLAPIDTSFSVQAQE